MARCRTRATASPERKARLRAPSRVRRPRAALRQGKFASAQSATIGKSSQAWILVSKARDQTAPAAATEQDERGDCMALALVEQSQSPEEAQKRVEGPEMGVCEDPWHRQQRPAGGQTGGAAPAAGRFGGDDPDQHRERQGRGKAAREDIKAGRIRPSPLDLEGLAQRRGYPQQPAAQGRMLGVVAEDSLDHRRGRRTASPGHEASPRTSGPAARRAARRP